MRVMNMMEVVRLGDLRVVRAPLEEYTDPGDGWFSKRRPGTIILDKGTRLIFDQNFGHHQGRTIAFNILGPSNFEDWKLFLPEKFTEFVHLDS